MPRFSRLDALNSTIETGIVPLFYNGDIETSKKILAACAEGGARAVEFTNRGDRALAIFTVLEIFASKEYPQLIMGAGSVANGATAAMYIQEGANFIVAPFFDESTAAVCNGSKIPYMPGCGSLTEIHKAELSGVEICKVFPGSQVGGPGFIKGAKAPCPRSNLMPTGGVAPTEENLRNWFEAGVCCVGLGSQLIPGNIGETGDYKSITEKLKFSIDFVKQVRSGK
ncbi:MAG: bifunctional 4-hydroxy-2-oxoglutarate aldolase/2-dehydro-3-deoxy-phosphogluconate aldolase [Spirochaetales bacterium]|nr:bifunctional 4-hydroxy-2-oxoglutarate aldolase/2-dehydro-3-deoxy-phosphogluconate aldolase [Spirochaetales bacterium]